MKKYFLSLVVAMMVATASFAQNTLVATLTHGETVAMYYGTNALRDAYNAAVSGDVINLSGGNFQSVDIYKAIALRGTGIDVAVPSRIMGNFKINIPTDDINRLSIEGIRCDNNMALGGTFENPYFMKCAFKTISFPNTETFIAAIKNAMFIDCKFYSGNNSISSVSGPSSVQFINCYVDAFRSSEGASCSFINCVVGTYASNVRYLYNCQFVNSIIYNTYYNGENLPTTSIATNCIAVNGGRTFFSNQSNPNCSDASFEEVFKDFTGSYSEDQTFELTYEAKTRYLGTDGTQIGIYGGVMPYTSIPSYPRITKMNVASKTTADGKLSVDIEVSAAE